MIKSSSKLCNIGLDHLFDHHTILTLSNQKIETVGDFFFVPAFDLAFVLNNSAAPASHGLLVTEYEDVEKYLEQFQNVKAAQNMIKRVSEKVWEAGSSGQNLFDMMRNKIRIPTTLVQLDMALKGGIDCGSLTEIVGPWGVGKTQFCMMMAWMVAASSHDVVYIDTEGAFSAKRIVEMADTADADVIKAALTRILILDVRSLNDLVALFDGRLENEVIANRRRNGHALRLIVVDSVAAITRGETDNIASRQKRLTAIAAKLKKISQVYNVAVVVTNQLVAQNPSHKAVFDTVADIEFVDDGLEGFVMAPALGTAWLHSVNTRLSLAVAAGNMQGQRYTSANLPLTSIRTITITKSPVAANHSFPYVIAKSGLVEPPC